MFNQHKCKRRQTVDEIISELEKTVERSTDESIFIYELYQRLLPVIKSIARRYSNLSKGDERFAIERFKKVLLGDKSSLLNVDK